MLRVAHVMAGAEQGGAELFFERLCVALHQAGDTVLPIIRHDASRAQRLRSAGLPVRQLQFGGPFDWDTTPRLRQVLSAFAPQIVVSWMSRATAHMPHGPWVSVGRLGGYYDLRHYRACDHLVGNARGIVDWLRANGWAEARTHYLPNFSHDLATAASAGGSTSSSGVLLALGRLHTDKGFDTLIAALALVPGAHLLIAGVGPEQRRLKALALRFGVSDRLSLLGWRQDIADLMASCHVFVCSSRVEPLGNIVLEAWSAGRPVVAVAATGPCELVCSGRDGILVPLENPAALAKAVRTVLDNRCLAASLASAGRKRFETEFSAAVVVHRWRSLLGKLANNPE